MNIKQAEKIIHEYGKIMEKIGKEMMKKYPAAVFPKSLLPYSKEIIKMAAETFLLYSENGNGKDAIKAGLAWLDGFINDEEANERNNKFLNNSGFMEALRKK